MWEGGNKRAGVREQTETKPKGKGSKKKKKGGGVEIG